MTRGFGNGPRAAIRLAKLHAEQNGVAGLECVDAQFYDRGASIEQLREKGLVEWTVRFSGRPRGPYDDGSVLVHVNLETQQTKPIGRSSTPQ